MYLSAGLINTAQPGAQVRQAHAAPRFGRRARQSCAGIADLDAQLFALGKGAHDDFTAFDLRFKPVGDGVVIITNQRLIIRTESGRQAAVKFGGEGQAFLYNEEFPDRAKALMMLYKRLREIDVPEMMASIIVEPSRRPNSGAPMMKINTRPSLSHTSRSKQARTTRCSVSASEMRRKREANKSVSSDELKDVACATPPC